MAKITDPSKLLPSSKLSSTLAKGGKGNTINIVSKSTLLQKSPKNKKESKKEKKDSDDIREKLINIEKFLKSSFTTSQKKAEVKRKQKEKEDFDEAEKKLETPKTKAFKLPGISLTSIGFFERIKRFLFFTALGWLVPKIIEFLPKLKGLGNIIGGVYKFAEGMFGKLFDGFMSLVKFGGDLKNKTLGFIASAKAGVGGNYETEFKKLENQFNTFANLSIVAGLLATDIGLAAVDEFNKWNKKNASKGKEGGKPKPKGEKPSSKKPEGKPKKSGGVEKPGKPKKPPKLKGPFAKFGKLLGKFGGALIPGVGAVVGEMDARARFASGDNIGGWVARISAILDGFSAAVGLAALATAPLGLTGVGLAVPAALLAAASAASTVSMLLDGILFVRDLVKLLLPGVPMFSKGGRVVKKYQGGGTTRGGRPVGGPPRRTLRTSNKLKKPPKVSLPKTQPGKDVGGEKKIKEFYAKPEDPNKKYLRPSGGWLSTLFGDKKQDLSVFDTLNKMSGTLKSDQTIAKGILGLMSSGIDMALGQKPDKKIFKSFFDTIAYISDTLANQRASKSMSSLMSQIRGFAEGGSVPSRELRRTYEPHTSDLLAKILEPTIEQKVNEAIQSIQKELMLKGKGTGTGVDTNGEESSRFGGTSGGEYGGYAPQTGLQKEIYEYLINEKKLSDVQALGLMANISRESSFKPNASGDSGRSVGLFQWKDVRGTAMRKAVPNWETNWKGQIDYALKEPKNLSMVSPGEYQSRSFSSAQEAADWWMRVWERPADTISGSNVHKGYLKSIPKGPDGTAKFREAEMPTTDVGVGQSKVSEDIANFRKFRTQFGGSKNRNPTYGSNYYQIREMGTYGSGNYQISPLADDTNYEIDVHRGAGHWENRAFDIPVPRNSKEGDMIAEYWRNRGYTVIWKSSGHYDHVHVEVPANKAQEWFKINKNAGTLSMKDGKEGIMENGKWKAKPWTKEEKERYNKVNGSQSAKLGQPSKPSSSTSNLNIISASNMSGAGILDRIRNIKPGQKIIFDGVGSIQGGRNWFGGLEKKYYDTKGNPISQKQFNDMLQGSKVLDKIKTNDKKVQNMQGGGLIGPKSSRLPIPNSFASYETYGSGPMIVIQPMIIEKQVPIYSAKNSPITFPVPVSVNNSSAQSLSRG
jgi:hypothetical protein